MIKGLGRIGKQTVMDTYNSFGLTNKIAKSSIDFMKTRALTVTENYSYSGKFQSDVTGRALPDSYDQEGQLCHIRVTTWPETVYHLLQF